MNIAEPIELFIATFEELISYSLMLTDRRAQYISQPPTPLFLQ